LGSATFRRGAKIVKMLRKVKKKSIHLPFRQNSAAH